MTSNRLLKLTQHGAAPDRAKSEARSTKYLSTILRLSYDNAKLTIDLRWTSHLKKWPTSYRDRKDFLTYDLLAKT